jgi:type I restriction enzyme S subunit
MSFPRYDKYKDSGVEWLGEVPEHWGLAPLKRGFQVTLGKMLKPESSSPEDELRPYLRAANIQWGKVDVSDIKLMWFSPI